MYLCLQVPETSGVSNVLNPSSSASDLLSILTTTISDTCCYSFFLHFLVPHHHDYCLLPANKDATLLFCSFKITDQAEKNLSSHHFLPNWVHWSLSWQHLCRASSSSLVACPLLAFSADLRFQNSFPHCRIHPTASGSIFKWRVTSRMACPLGTNLALQMSQVIPKFNACSLWLLTLCTPAVSTETPFKSDKHLLHRGINHPPKEHVLCGWDLEQLQFPSRLQLDGRPSTRKHHKWAVWLVLKFQGSNYPGTRH